MSEDSTTQCLLFPGIFRKPVVAQFDQREGSSDGGALLLKAADRHYGLVAGLASCLRDERQAGKVDHSLRELVAQRVFSIACGYPDANDSARLSGDPIHKLLAGPRSDRRSRPGFAADVVAFRERSWGQGTLSRGRVPGRERDPTPRQAAASSHLSRHHRSGPDRRSHARRAAVVVLQRTLRHLVLPAGDGFCQLQRRSRTVSLRRGVTARQRDGGGGRGRHAAAFGEDDSSPYSWSTDSGTPGWRFRASGRARVSGRPAQTRVCRRDGQECRVEAGC